MLIKLKIYLNNMMIYYINKLRYNIYLKIQYNT
jgi:hypothetical protein